MIYAILGIAAAVILAGIAIWYFFFRTPSGGEKIFHLPLRDLGLKEISAVPITIIQIPGTLIKLTGRKKETTQAKNGLSNLYTLKGRQEPAFNFLFGLKASGETGDAATLSFEAAVKELKNFSERKTSEQFLSERHFDHWNKKNAHQQSKDAVDPLQLLPMESPDQFSMGWTNYYTVYQRSLPLLDNYAQSVVDAKAATENFWPLIATQEIAFNLILPQKITGGDGLLRLTKTMDAAEAGRMESLANNGLLYVIDLSIFKTLKSNKVHGLPRFTPSTVTYLEQDPLTKNLLPISIEVSGYQGAGQTLFVRGKVTDSAWVYALTAARCSATVWGVWIGHVYHWHMQTASLQMTMFNTFQKDAPVYTLMAPQSDYLIAFDMVLLLLWKNIAPPTSVSSAMQFLELMNTMATGRTFFMDDPKTTLQNLNLSPQDFTRDPAHPWDAYPVVKHLLFIWEATENYITTFVEEHYATDAAVANDTELQRWFAVSADPSGGNIHFGDFTLNSRQALIKLLTSIIYRITAHGSARMDSAANPVLSFVGNFPPCLQRDDIPKTDSHLSKEELLQYLPHTGTIGEMLNFLYTFIYSAPYVPFVPEAGVGANLFFDPARFPKSNQALIDYRAAIRDFIPVYSPASPIVNQWPLNIET